VSYRRLFRHLTPTTLLAGCLAGCAGGPAPSAHDAVPPTAILGTELELMREPVLAARVSISPINTAHVAALTDSGRLVHLAVGEDKSRQETTLGEINAEDLYDVAVGSDGTVHALLVKTYLRFSGIGRSVAPAGRCERIEVTDAHTFCVGPLDAGIRDSQDRGGWEGGLGQLGPQQARKFVLSAFTGNGWSALAVLERDSTWQVLAAEIVPDRAGTVHILYLAYGPLDASLNRRTLVRLASFRLAEGSRAAEALPVVDVWELDPEVGLPSSPELEAARLRPGTLVTRARYGLTQSAADTPLLALARPAGAAQTIVGAGATPGVQIGADPTEVVLLEEGRLLRKLPPRAETTGWATLVLSTLLAPGGKQLFHAVTVTKGDFLGFSNRVRYQQIAQNHWTSSLDLGLTEDRADLVRLGAGEQGDAFVVLPGRRGGLVGRWITLAPGTRN
jgi:hypothetical protein